MYLFFSRLQSIAQIDSITSWFLPHFAVICDLLLNRRKATWNLFVKERRDASPWQGYPLKSIATRVHVQDNIITCSPFSAKKATTFSIVESKLGRKCIVTEAITRQTSKNSKHP